MPESKLFKEIAALRTEKINPESKKIDESSVREILKIINEEDKKVPEAIEKCLPEIENAVNLVVAAFKSNGRLIYTGAGTSGRLGILDAAECPPTFGSDPDMVQGLIAGGREAVFVAQEGAEDDPQNGVIDIERTGVKPPDVVCGIAASGRTPYVKGALNEAKRKGCKTIIVTTSTKKHIEELEINADVVIDPDVGPEVIAGSTRMKSGTAQKLILNMITTTAMVRIGKTLGNVMIDLQLTNSKLGERAKRTIMDFTGVNYSTAENVLNEAGGSVKTALVMILGDVDQKKAHELLKKSDGFVRKALKFANVEIN